MLGPPRPRISLSQIMGDQGDLSRCWSRPDNSANAFNLCHESIGRFVPPVYPLVEVLEVIAHIHLSKWRGIRHAKELAKGFRLRSSPVIGKESLPGTPPSQVVFARNPSNRAIPACRGWGKIHVSPNESVRVLATESASMAAGVSGV